ncbi:MAG: hypothetical protein GC201_00745 [Alphaproteobacteria bacterium]|nr:hypothetical protein [Alphaproteobacteria bacterium]
MKQPPFPRSSCRAALAAAALLSLSAAAPAVADGCASYGPPAEGFVGMLSALQMSGPPGYGKTPDIDTVETVPVLQLSPPICVAPKPGGAPGDVAEQSVDTVELAAAPGAPIPKDLFGTKVMVKGTLSHASGPDHPTAVVLRVIGVRQVLKEDAPAGAP